MASSGPPSGRPDEVVLGRLRRPWGRRGELVIEVHTDWPEQRFAPGARLRLAWDDGRSIERVVRGFRALTQGSMLAFEGVDDIGGAQDLAGAWLVADRADLPAPDDDPDGVLHADLVGAEVVTTAGEAVGQVVGIDETAAQDLLRVRRPGGGEALIPVVPAICVAIDREAGRVVIDAIPGLLDLSRAEVADGETAPAVRHRAHGGRGGHAGRRPAATPATKRGTDGE